MFLSLARAAIARRGLVAPITAPSAIVLTRAVPLTAWSPWTAIAARLASSSSAAKSRSSAASKAHTARAKGTAAGSKKKPAAKKKPVLKKKKKPAKKPAAKKKKPAKKAPLTPAEKEKVKTRELKRLALLKGPKLLPANNWSVYVSQNFPAGTEPLATKVKKCQAGFRALPASEKERLTSTARANVASNQRTRQAWIESHPYEAIYVANLARRQLARKLKTGRVTLLHDTRQPRRGPGSYGLFIKSRYQEHSDAGSNADIFRAIATEWKSLSEADKKPFRDQAATESRRATAEFDAARSAGKSFIQARKSASPSSPRAP